MSSRGRAPGTPVYDEPPEESSPSESDWRSRIVGLTYEDPASLLAHPKNPNIHPETQQSALRAALSEIGWITGVLVNDLSAHIIDGHDRVENAISTGQSRVPVIHVELTDEEEDLALATFDNIALMAGRDREKLDLLVQDIGQRSAAALNSLLQTMATQQRWPQLRVSDNEHSHGHVGPSRSPLSATQQRARWTVMFRRDQADEVRQTLAQLREALGPQAELTWLEG